MEIFEIIHNLELNLQAKEDITEELYKVNIDLSAKKKEHRISYAAALTRLQNQKFPKELAQSRLSNEMYDIDLLEEKKMYLYNKLVNIRQELNILSVLLKNEQELLK